MKKHWIEYQDEMPKCPMTHWVHKPATGKLNDDTLCIPPRQEKVGLKGYPIFKVELDGFVFNFSSLQEIEVCIETFSEKVLPQTISYSENETWSNAHWISRLPKNVKSLKYRQKAISYLQQAMIDFKNQINA